MTVPLQSITEANRASWNQIAPDRPGQPAEFFRTGGLVLEDFEQQLAGDVRGKRILQIACSCGEVLSWANLGANAIGTDISEVAIERAREKAALADIQADFRRADMYDLPADLTDLDLIYFSWGAICWAPDLNLLAQALTARLRPGGSILLAEHHPIWEVLAVRGDSHLTVAGDYFGRTTPTQDTDDSKRPVGARGTANPPPFSAFVWPVSESPWLSSAPTSTWTRSPSPPPATATPTSAQPPPTSPPITSSRPPNPDPPASVPRETSTARRQITLSTNPRLPVRGVDRARSRGPAD